MAADPKAMFKGAIGMFVGPVTDVVLDGSFDVKMTVAGTTELESLVLSYGELVEVVSPVALREKMGGVLRRAVAKYDDTREETRKEA